MRIFIERTHFICGEFDIQGIHGHLQMERIFHCRNNSNIFPVQQPGQCKLGKGDIAFLTDGTGRIGLFEVTQRTPRLKNNAILTAEILQFVRRITHRKIAVNLIQDDGNRRGFYRTFQPLCRKVADAGTGGLHRCFRRWSLQAGNLPLLTVFRKRFHTEHKRIENPAGRLSPTGFSRLRSIA